MTPQSEAPRRLEQPYLFTYDIRCPRRGRQVLQCLRRWRVDGQLSVHETWLAPPQVRELATELVGLVDRATDSVVACRLTQRRSRPIYQWFAGQGRAPLFGGQAPATMPERLHQGWYLLAYDVRDPDRLRRVQRRTAQDALFIQRSVYLYQGGGTPLNRLVQEVGKLLVRGKDDLRLYVLSGPRDLWFLSGAIPPLPGQPQPTAAAAPDPPKPLWRRLIGQLPGLGG